ncbi:filamentous haemagglutinin family protein [Thiobacillus sp.]|uniref:filamentous haemagglutinin family protein n=1 Tax=Thiobacillus sp. TaxID=924 RepID=UPI0025CF80CF|nr:filamentous haemagglutinin family protein [Thiobacillus sp.]MBT9538318.1 filamentous hemagglutinin family protein [Thiobacillus sp.]
MNRNCYRLVFNTTLGMMVPVAETARRSGKASSGTAVSGAVLALAGALLAGSVQAELPVASANFAAPGTMANYQVNGAQAYVNQVGNKAIMNFDRFNISAGHDVQFRQVDSLATQNLVQGASFSALARIHDINPSIIAGSISQAAGQRANVTLVNSNGIAFMGGSQVNLGSFTASTLNIADSYINDTLLTRDGKPQFENALDGGEGRGFIKVFEGARITASSQGRVMLIAPTVINKGTITAPDGQVIVAAAMKVFLRTASAYGDDNVRGLLVEVDSPAGLADFDTANTDVKDGLLDGVSVKLTNAAEDKLGHVTNLGELSSQRGNVTMVGYAVNQQGIARATTSVVANGSVYLLAKDRTAIPATVPEQTATGSRSQRAGRVVLGANSLTEVLPDVADATGALDGTTGQGLPAKSQVQVLGQDVRMEGGAVINAPSADVNIVAMDQPTAVNLISTDPFKGSGGTSAIARVHIADGARINVAGLENVQVSVARNSVEVELRGDELKDSPVNRDGVLKGEKVYVDIARAQALADAGESTLIAQDSLASYQAKLERTVAERSTAGGTVNIHSQGEAILETGAVVDLSGGSVQYTAANVKTTLLSSGGQTVDIADADAETRYDGIATRYVKDFGRWNVKKVYDLGQSYRFDPGYVEGKDAGVMQVIGMGGTVMQAEVQGRITVGERQRESGAVPATAKLILGTAAVTGDYKLNQQIDVTSTAATLPASFGFGEALPAHLKSVLAFNPSSMGEGKIGQLEIFSNQAAVVREALRTPQGGSVKITAAGVDVAADVTAQGGQIAFNARGNQAGGPSDPDTLNVNVRDGVKLSARGEWINQVSNGGTVASTGASIDGGSVTLSATNDVELGEASSVDVSGGGRVEPDGKVDGGNGGTITLEANAGAESSVAHSGEVGLGGELRGYGMEQGGTLKVSSGKIQIGGAADNTEGALNLGSGFLGQGGFSTFDLTGRDGVTVADGVVLAPVQQTLELQPGFSLQASGSPIDAFAAQVVLEPRLRKPVNLTLSADSYTQGDVRIGEGARIALDDQAAFTINAAHRIDIQGAISTHGGTITANLNRSTDQPFDPASTLWLGDQAVLDVSGAARTYTDNRGLTQGEVLAGGAVKLNAQIGYVVTEAGSAINVSGAAPVQLDVRNEAGGLGRNVGSDAGSLTVVAREGALLDGALVAQAGSAANRGGSFDLTLGDNATPSGYPTDPRVISLANTVAAQAIGLASGDAIPGSMDGQVKLGTAALEAAGFDRIALNSRDAIRLENGLDLGANRALPLREVTLDAPRIETAGGDATLRADTLRLGNYDAGRQAVINTPVTGSGTFRADARLLELAGKQTLTGMARSELTGTKAIRLAGVSASSQQPVGVLRTAADMRLTSAVIAPASFTQYTLAAPGQNVEFARNTDQPVQPLSALGSFKVEAADIVQDGNIWAPFGQLEFKASGALVFRDGSLTSVAAAPGSVIPFGRLVNGQDWKYAVGSKLFDQNALEEKSIRVTGANVDMQAGAKVNLAGGGDLQAYEFTVGPGGSRDILADANTYAILPGAQAGFAPGDTQEGFDRASGEAVYLSGVPGLADGVYTLLPAHYALLPGAYAVKLDTGISNVMPGQAYSRQDGVRIAAGYTTDTRNGAPKDASWQGVQVMTHDQVRARSEFTLTRASDFYAGSSSRTQDAGLLSVSTSGSGVNALKLDADYGFAAAAGGRGAQVDISASKIAVTSGSPAGIDPDAVVLDVDSLNAMGADSLLIGGTRAASGDTSTLTVGATSVTLANDAAHALQADEVMLAAKDTLTLKAGSAIDAQGAAGDVGAYETAGSGAFVRAASTTAAFTRTGNPLRTVGTLVGEAGSTIAAADSIVLDATQTNDYQGVATFVKNGVSVAGNLAVGATRVNFGAAPPSAEGITYSQAELDAIDLKSLALSSYSTFDLYGDVRVGQLDANGKPVMQNLVLQGAGLAGIDNAGQTAQLNAQNLTLANSSSATYAAGGTLGSGNLAVTADTLTLGAGAKAIKGFGAVTVTANELVAATGTGSLAIDGPATMNVARISGEKASNQSLTATGALTVAQHAADRTLAPVTALGAKWAMQGSSVDFNSHAELPSGTFKLTATTGNVALGTNAQVDVAGRAVQFFDVTKPSWGGTAEFVSDTGNVVFDDGAKVDVSAAAGGDAGTLIVRAANGTVSLADGSVSGTAAADADGQRGEGARAVIDTGTLASFSALNTALNSGGFAGERDLRVRTGDVSIASTDVVKAQAINISVDGDPGVVGDGKLVVAGTLDASGEEAGRIELFAKHDVNVKSTAKLAAASSGANEDGGDIVIGTRDGQLNLEASDQGKGIDATGGASGQGGTVQLRAPRINGDTDVAVSALDTRISGARSVTVEAVKVYDYTGDKTLTSSDLDTIKTDNDSFATHQATIKNDLGKSADPLFHIVSGVEVHATGDLTLGDLTPASDWNLSTARAGGEAGVLTLAADGNLNINSNLSDGFSHATPCTTATCNATNPSPATVLADESWSYRLVAGADAGAADPLAVVRNANGGNVTLAAGKLIRSGTGNIQVRAGGNIALADNKSAIYSAGRASPAIAGFTSPSDAQFSQGGGDVSLAALGDIASPNRSKQLYSNWLFRQGKLDSTGTAYETDLQTAWWVRFDQFQQGVGALGGGDVSLVAGGKVENVSASTPTQARMASTTPDANALIKTGGGTVRVETGGDVLGGQYYADNGELVIRAGGKLDSGEKVGTGVNAKPLYTILALGDAQANVRAQDDVNIHAVMNPHLMLQSLGAGSNANVSGVDDAKWSLFSTYGENSGFALTSLSGATRFHNAAGSVATFANAYTTPIKFSSALGKYNVALLSILPPNLSAAAFQGDVSLAGNMYLSPASNADLTVLAAKHVNIPSTLTMSDAIRLPDPVLPGEIGKPGAASDQFFNAASTQPKLAHAVTPVHIGDTEPVRIYAVGGDVSGSLDKLNLVLPKAVQVRAGQDVNNLGFEVQHVAASDTSVIAAGRDFRFDSEATRSSNARVRVGGPGSLEVTAGRDIDLGTSIGIVSRGNLDNSALPIGGANIHLAAGVGENGIDYAGTVDRLEAQLALGAVDDTSLWLARWLTGDESLSETNALAAVQSINALAAGHQQARVRDMLLTALRATGRDSLNKDSAYAGDYARGYAALELAFPGIGNRDATGEFTNYQGRINLFASRIMTEQGGDIEFMIPGGDLVVGLSNTPAALTTPPTSGKDAGVLGIVTADVGDIKGFARDNILVNQSRILTVAGGDVLLWSSEGDIDAGKGKKTATSVPPPIITVDADGNVTQKLQGAATGSGIGALSTGGRVAGDVDLIAHRGKVNAGDAGIRANKVRIGGRCVNCDNIEADIKIGTPPPDDSAVTAASSGATNADGGMSDATAALSNNLADAARAAEELKQSFKPTFITAEVVGHGE